LGAELAPETPQLRPQPPWTSIFAAMLAPSWNTKKVFRCSKKHSKNKLLGEGVFCSISDPWGGHVGSMLGGFWKVFGRFCQVVFSSVALLRSAVKNTAKLTSPA